MEDHMYQTERLEWAEMRLSNGVPELFFVCAERVGAAAKWRFMERSTWEVRWFDAQANRERIMQVEEPLRTAEVGQARSTRRWLRPSALVFHAASGDATIFPRERPSETPGPFSRTAGP